MLSSRPSRLPHWFLSVRIRSRQTASTGQERHRPFLRTVRSPLKQIDYGHTLRIERNSYYFRDTDKPDALDKYVIPWRIVTHYDYGDINAQFDAYMNSSIWYLGTIPLAQREAVKKQAVISDELATHTYYFNVKNDLFKDARVRRALSMAIDREQIVSIVTYAKAATGLIPYGVSDANGQEGLPRGC